MSFFVSFKVAAPWWSRRLECSSSGIHHPWFCDSDALDDDDPAYPQESVLSYGVLVTSCAGDGSCETSQPPPSASINPALAVIC